MYEAGQTRFNKITTQESIRMLDLNATKKNKITLADYDYEQDIRNRVLLAGFSALDYEVLEEIFFSSIKASVLKIARNLDREPDEILPTLEKLEEANLLTLEGDVVTIDKDQRKYFEAQTESFDEDFKPNMEFLQSLLKKVPIQVLPTWYPIPRTSDNIFDSIIEKYLLTPQIYLRYLMELNFQDPVLKGIMNDVFQSDDLKIFSEDLIKKYNLSHSELEEYILHLEFNFVCCLSHEKCENEWKEIITPFFEWRQYQKFLRNNHPIPLSDPSNIEVYDKEAFAFIKDMALVLELAKQKPFFISMPKGGYFELTPETLHYLNNQLCVHTEDPSSYIHSLISKLLLLKLADIVDGKFYTLDAANDWLEMRLENRAIYMYRHPMNTVALNNVSASLFTDRNLRETEKSIQRVLAIGWVDFEEFMKGATIALSERSTVVLKKLNRSWAYSLPTYTKEELDFIESVIFHWLFELGVVSIGTYKDKRCFRVTEFGKILFG